MHRAIITYGEANTIFEYEVIPTDAGGNPFLQRVAGQLRWIMPIAVASGSTLHNLKMRFNLYIITDPLAGGPTIVGIQLYKNGAVVTNIIIPMVLADDANAGWHTISGEFTLGDITMPTPQADQSFDLRILKSIAAAVEFYI